MRRTTKILFLLFLILLLWGGFFGFEKCWAEESGLIITEIMYNPEGTDSGREWLELYNSSDKNISIEKNILGLIDEKEDRNESGELKNVCHRFENNLEIDSKKFAVIGDKKSSFENDYPDFEGDFLDSVLDLNNTEDTVKISFDKCITWEIEIKYSSSWGGKDNSIEKINFTGEDEKNNWQESYKKGGTPGENNSVKPEPKVYSDKIRINELLPKPDPENILYPEEFVELYSLSDKPENLDGWYLKDRAGKICDLTGKIIDPVVSRFLILKNDSADCTLALNDTQGEFLGLYNPVDATPISSVSYEGSAKKGRSYDFNGTAWHWSQFLTAGGENIFNNEPYGTVKIDKNIFINVYADFFVSTGDADGEKVKVVWDFGDGHKSYLEKTRHKYEQEGAYAGTVKLSDSSEDVIKNFTVEVKKYPTPKIKIVKLLANPKGKDNLGEEIYFKNTSKKKINLKTWSLATGDKNLYNHPITKDFIIQPGKTKKITRKYSLFTLNNKKGIIELRYPNGEVASRVKYDKKKESVKDDEVYELSGKKWQWNDPAEEIPSGEVNLPEGSSAPEENSENINPETELDISEEEISLNLGKYSSENKLALAEIKFKSIGENILQSRETPGIVLGAFSARNEFHKPIEIKPTSSWQKTLQKSNRLFNLLINQFMNLI